MDKKSVSNATNVIMLRPLLQDQPADSNFNALPNPLQLDLIPSVQPDLFADISFELGFGR